MMSSSTSPSVRPKMPHLHPRDFTFNTSIWSTDYWTLERQHHTYSAFTFWSWYRHAVGYMLKTVMIPINWFFVFIKATFNQQKRKPDSNSAWTPRRGFMLDYFIRMTLQRWSFNQIFQKRTQKYQINSLINSWSMFPL